MDSKGTGSGRYQAHVKSHFSVTFYCMESRNQCNFVCSCLRAMRK